MATAFSLAAVTLAGCGPHTDSRDALEAIGQLPREATATTPAVANTTATSTPTPIPQRAADCNDARESFAPDPLPPAGEMPAGSYMETILKNGHLSVGVDENTLGLAYRNPETGNIEGFEVKLAVEIARHIFADNDPEAHVDEVPVLTDEKVSAVREATVDLTIDAITMSCDRWQLVDFSTEYYTADQQFLVRSGSPIKTESDLVGRRVCVTSDSSSEKIMTKRVPNAELVPVASRTECLVALQEGEVDAYFGHDSFLYGMTEQDRTLKVMPLLPQAETLSHYGIAVNKEHPEFVRFVNAVLDELRQDGTWSDFHEQLVDDLPDLPPADPPKPRYRD